jgi:hypothetical protein
VRSSISNSWWIGSSKRRKAKAHIDSTKGLKHKVT